MRGRLLVIPLLAAASGAAFWFESTHPASPWLHFYRTADGSIANAGLSFLTVTFTGAGLVFILLVAYVCGARGKVVFRALLAMAIGGLVCAALKFTTLRLRPDGSNHLSFPSGHTTAVAAAAASFAGRGVRRNALLALWVAAGALSRITLSKHYPSDVLAGAALGTSVALVMSRVRLLASEGASRTFVLWFLLAAFPLVALLLPGYREFFAGLAPGLWLAAFAVHRRRVEEPAASLARGPAPL